MTPPEKGTPAREAMAAVFEALQAGAGGENGHLTAWALENPTEFYRLWARLTEDAAGGPPMPPQILAAFEKLSPERRAALRACLRAALAR